MVSANPGASIQDTERAYAFMTHITEALGVNCTGCHNTRSYFAWDQSRPQRVPAWYGIRMARDLNDNYLTPLTAAFPPERLGPTGDVAKISCATCHQGASKPLNGVSMLKDYPELQPARPMPTQPLPDEMAPGAAASDLQTSITGKPSAPVSPARMESGA
jgi:photosynthetic reaction center cytochrome c subunit